MKEILETLEKVSYSNSRYQVFEDWLDLMLDAMQEKNDEYLKIVKKYDNTGEKGKRPIDYFSQAFGLLMKEMSEKNEDILGKIYMSWNVSNKHTGQFFTPSHIAGLMADLVAVEKDEKDKPKSVLDPCCGSGTMLIEALKKNPNATFYGQDIDLTCVKMCALNLMFFNVNGFVVWGDALKLEVNKVYQTAHTFLGGMLRELEGENLEEFRKNFINRADLTKK